MALSWFAWREVRKKGIKIREERGREREREGGSSSKAAVAGRK